MRGHTWICESNVNEVVPSKVGVTSYSSQLRLLANYEVQIWGTAKERKMA
jgi:hypothetical protein